MWEVRACRVCLAREGRMDPPDKHRLHRAYETVAGLPLVEECGMPQWLCVECAHSLRKWSAFRSRCRRAGAVLRAIYDAHMQITEEEIAKVDRKAAMLISPRAVLKLAPMIIEPSQCFEVQVAKVKGEESTAGYLAPEVMLLVKKEELGAEFSPPRPEPDHNDSDSLKDEPLTKYSRRNLQGSKSIEPKKLTKRMAKPKSKPKAKMQPDKTASKQPVERNRYPQSFYEEFATVTTPTKEQQLEEIQQRRNTDNYIHSPFKCTICYRGFVEESAFRNHLVKHDPASGEFECDICRRRFRLRRVLNKHIAGNHTRRYSCRSCQHVCANPCQARLHEKWHKGTRYQCSHCDDSFVKLSSYLSHLRIKHTSQFVCDICGNAFVSKKGVSHHKNLAHKQQEISLEGPYCGECDVRFASEEAFKVHLVSSAKHNQTKKVTLTTQVRNLKKFTCDECGDSFVRKYRLELHMKCRHTDTQEDGESKSVYGSECDIHISTEEELKGHTASSAKHSTNNDIGDEGGMMLESKAELTAHCRSHDKSVPVGAERGGNVKCKECDATFSYSRECYMHFKRMHPGVEYPMKKTFVCEVCGKYWPSNAALVSHLRVHTGEKPFQCSECPKRFGIRYRLEAHERTHSGDKPFACSECPKRFSLREWLQTHERTHTGERPFPCHVCPKAFSNQPALHRHSRVHTGIKPYECKHCGKTFSQSNSMKLHVHTVHLKLPTPYRSKRRRKQPVSSLASPQ